MKHFAVHSGPEADRHKEDVHPSAHDLEDTYLPAFRAAVIEGQALGLMCSYNAIDGIPACASPLLQERVRGAWGFKGHVVSDCAAIADIFLETSHHYVPTPEEAVSAALKAGTDLFCREFGRAKNADPQIIVDAVKQGLLDVAVVDRALIRLFEARVRLGMFDPPGHGPHANISVTDFDTPAHRTKSLEAARASLVLLKNSGLLPLTSEPARIAVIGPNADSIDALNGNYNGTPSAPITVLSGIRQRFPRSEVTFVEGTGLVVPEKPDDDAIARNADAAVAAAAKADLVVFVGGLSPRLEGEEMKVTTAGFSAGDRTTIDLPAPQQQLLERLHATGKPVVLVLLNGGAIAIDWADAHLPAIVEAWYPGGDGGRAVAELIGGDFSPSGRLPVTFYRSAEQLPGLKDYAMAGRTYRYFGGQALYPFGHGLSYTRFSYGRLELSRRQILAGESAEVSVAVTNSGKRAGDEVVQLYLSQATAGAAIRSLKGFRRVRLAPGETREVRFSLDPRAMSVVDPAGRRAVVPGRIDLWVGGGQPLTSIQGSRDSLLVTNRIELPK